MMTKQEMFDRAVRGLRAQGWQRAVAEGSGRCVYHDPETGWRCAWGHVDPEGTRFQGGGASVYGLRDMGIGVAAKLDEDELAFAGRLQHAHDQEMSAVPDVMERAFRALGRDFDLTWPKEADV